MPERTLPLDHERYQGYLARLRELVSRGDDLPPPEALRTFFAEHRDSFGPRTAQMLREAGPEHVRAMVHVMVLAASELADLHESSRNWLIEHEEALPPWDVAVPRTPQRLITFAGRVLGVVEWEPEKRVELSPTLTAAEHRWATALAVGIGERPQWTDEEVARFAAYLTMGTAEFTGRRGRSDAEVAEQYQVPEEAVRLRRTLPDELP